MAYPILADSGLWYTQGGTTTDKATITQINIIDSYTPTGNETETWDGSANKDRGVMVYIEGTTLTIASNGSGGIALTAYAAGSFENFTNVQTINGLELLDTSKVTNMCRMFHGCNNISSLNIGSWDVSSVTDMKEMFWSCQSLVSLDLSSWVTSSLKSLYGIFMSCSALTSINVSTWDVSNVYEGGTSNIDTMQAVFYGCSSLKSIDISSWDVSNCQNFFDMFFGCSSLMSLDLNNWNVGKAKYVRGMFLNCTALTSLGIGNWNTSSFGDMQSMFSGCTSLTTLDVSNWDVSKVTNFAGTFCDCTNLTTLDVSKWDTSSATDMQSMFYGCTGLTNKLDVSNWDVSKVTTFDHMFAHSYIAGLDTSKWVTSSAVNMNAMFHTVANEILNVSNFDTSNVKFFCQMFEQSNIKYIRGLANFDTSSGLGFDEMFKDSTQIRELNLSSFDTRNAKDGVVASNNGHKTKTLYKMFWNNLMLEKVVLGENFSFNGDGAGSAANVGVLPTPSSEYIKYADGNWYNESDESFISADIPTKTAATYYALPAIYRQNFIVSYGSLENIGNAVRGLTGTEEKYTLSNLPAKIEEAFAASDYGKGVEDGKKAQYDAFWASYMKTLINGGSAQNLFSGSGWNGDNFYPKYNMEPLSTATAMFSYFSWDSDAPYLDLAQRLKDCGVTLNTAYATVVAQMFTSAYVTHIPKISVISSTSLDRVFRGTKAVTIDELELKEDGTNTFNNIFQNCTALENIVITGTIGQNGFSVSDCTKLTKDSILGKVATAEQITSGKNLVELNGVYYYGGIIGALKNYKNGTSGTTHTITLGATNIAKLTDEEKAIITERLGWSLA